MLQKHTALSPIFAYTQSFVLKTIYHLLTTLASGKLLTLSPTSISFLSTASKKYTICNLYTNNDQRQKRPLHTEPVASENNQARFFFTFRNLSSMALKELSCDPVHTPIYFNCLKSSEVHSKVQQARVEITVSTTGHNIE